MVLHGIGQNTIIKTITKILNKIMEVLAVWIGISIIFLIIRSIQWNSEGEPYSLCVLCGFAIFALIVLEIFCIDDIVSKPQPRAMDVYQGKTTLEYTIKDGVKVDSIVVFKKNYNEK